jgi:hypothetical protein
MNRLLSPMAAGAAFWSALLLFWVQPMMGRLMLPRFGGAASVWIACLLVYQVLLFVGYVYAHWLTRRSERAQSLVHGMLLVGALLLIAVRRVVAGTWAFAMPSTGFGAPALDAVAGVALAVGLPYLCLSSTSTLVQAWLARRGVDSRVYHLYGISNAGSFAGLLLYPFVLEMVMPLPRQQDLWLGGFALFAVLLLALRARIRREGLHAEPADAGARAGPDANAGRAAFPRRQAVLWTVLAAAGTFVLVSSTAYVTLDVTPLPALWVVILGAYLATFVIGFSRLGERLLPLWALLALAMCVVQAVCDYALPRGSSIWTMASGLAMVFLGAQFLHAWLYAMRPPPRLLTGFYLCVAGGGALGGVMASLVAPLVFPDVWEYPVSVVCVACLVWLYLRRHRPPQLASVRRVAVFAVLAVVALNAGWIGKRWAGSLVMTRGFYGVVRVEEAPIWSEQTGERGYLRAMRHGTTIHGLERRLGGRRLSPGTYYAPQSGGALGLNQHPRRHETNTAFRVGVIGLGIGELLGYARPHDQWRVYEISPEVVAIAKNAALFTYVADCPAPLEIVLDDARRALERERAEGKQPRFDVFMVDAYSGDAIPLHLITKEAFDLYLDMLVADGYLALHLSNWHMDLLPLVKAVAETYGLHVRGVEAKSGLNRFVFGSVWAILSREPFTLDVPRHLASEIDWRTIEAGKLLTDDSGSVLCYVRIRRPTGHLALQRPSSSLRHLSGGDPGGL